MTELEELKAAADERRKLFDSEPFGMEDLDPELQPYVEEVPGLGTVIRHPLVYSVPHAPPLNRFVNSNLSHKKFLVSKAEFEGNWRAFIFLHERPWRFQAFCDVRHHITSPRAFWSTLKWVWSDCENVRQNYDRWLQMWEDPSWKPSLVMAPKTLASLRTMPDVLTIWRGMLDPAEIDGISWTLDERTAHWFAGRYTNLREDRPYVAKATANRDDVRALILDRNEREIVILPQHVKLEKIVQVPRLLSRMRGPSE